METRRKITESEPVMTSTCGDNTAKRTHIIEKCIRNKRKEIQRSSLTRRTPPRKTALPAHATSVSLLSSQTARQGTGRSASIPIQPFHVLATSSPINQSFPQHFQPSLQPFHHAFPSSPRLPHSRNSQQQIKDFESKISLSSTSLLSIFCFSYYLFTYKYTSAQRRSTTRPEYKRKEHKAKPIRTW